MPRNKETDQFEAGSLRTITYNKQSYFVDGRTKEVRHTEDFMDKLDVNNEFVFSALSKEDQETIMGEFYGYN